MRFFALIACALLCACSSHSEKPASYGPASVRVVETTATGRDSLDDSASIAANIAALQPNQTLHFPAGVYHLDSAYLAAHPLLIPCSDIGIAGDGAASTRIVVTGASVTPWIFAAVGKSNIAFSGLSFVGNNAADSYGNGGALVFTNTTAPACRLTVSGCRFDNFKGDFWIYVENTSGLSLIDGISVTWCEFITRPGNSRLPHSVAGPQGMVGVIAHNSAETGGINNVRIDSNDVQCSHAKGLLALFGNCEGISICNNNIIGAATGPEFADDCAGYAVMCYNNFKPPRKAVVSANRIVGVRDCGFYLLNCADFSVTGNYVSGQTSNAYETLPKAGIACNEMLRGSIVGNTVVDCKTGIYFQGSPLEPRTSSLIADNVVSGSGRACINIESSIYPWSDLTVSGNRLSSLAQGVFINANAPIHSISISDNDIRAQSWGVRAISGDELYRMKRLVVSGNVISGNDTELVSHVSARFFQSAESSISLNHLMGFSYVPVDVYGSTGIAVSGNITP